MSLSFEFRPDLFLVPKISLLCLGVAGGMV